MPDPTDSAQTIATNGQAPLKMMVDGQLAQQHRLPDQIAADRYAKSSSAVKKRGFPVRFIKFIPPGAC
jgi:hypothetical protein